MDVVAHAQLAALDQKNRHPDTGGPLPVLTTLMFGVCDSDIDKFNEVCRLVEIIQRVTIELHDKEKPQGAS